MNPSSFALDLATSHRASVGRLPWFGWTNRNALFVESHLDVSNTAPWTESGLLVMAMDFDVLVWLVKLDFMAKTEHAIVMLQE